MNSESSKASTSKVPKIKPSNFCVQLHSLLENPRDPESLRWVDGEVDQFQITVDESKGLEALRPNLDFKSMSSFVRQLSYYDFKRLSDRRKPERRGEARVVVFTHNSGLFTRGNPANVEKMKRKLRIRADRTRRASAVSTGSVDEEYSQSQSGSPLFSPNATVWSPNEQPLPLPSPPVPTVLGSGMGLFSLSTPPPPRTRIDPPPSNEIIQQLSPGPSTYDSPRYTPYGRHSSYNSSEHRSSIVSLTSESSNPSPRSRSAELAYYAGPHPIQPASYFAPPRPPVSPLSVPHPPSYAVPTGLPVAYDNSSRRSSSHSATASAYPPLSSLNQYRPPPPPPPLSSYSFPDQAPPDQQRTEPLLGFRNHERFISVPSLPYPHYTPPRSDEYHSPTSVPDEDYNRRAALEARRTSYPFPHPSGSASLPIADDTLPTPYAPSQAVSCSTNQISEWNEARQNYYATPPIDPIQAPWRPESETEVQYQSVAGNAGIGREAGTGGGGETGFQPQTQPYYNQTAGGGGGGGEQIRFSDYHPFVPQ